MVNHCANPVCHKPLHYLREGKVFLFSRKQSAATDSALPPLEHFWLCGRCAKEWTLALDAMEKVKLIKTRRGHLRAGRLVPVPLAS